MDNKDTISVLNDLIETSKDGELGFTECADDLKSAKLKTFMVNRSKECATAATELQQVVRSLGGKPEKDTSMSGDLHRRWVGLKGLVTGKDETSILNEAERGEDVAMKSYKKALEKELPPEVRELVQKQYQGVKSNHDQVRALRDASRAQ
jgi:uncharacterized protein (TIGR02284 family)